MDKLVSLSSGVPIIAEPGSVVASAPSQPAGTGFQGVLKDAI